MHGAMTATTERDQSFEGFASETLGGAAVDVVTQRPFDPALVLTRLHAHPIVDASPRKGVPVGSPLAVSRGVPA